MTHPAQCVLTGTSPAHIPSLQNSASGLPGARRRQAAELGLSHPWGSSTGTPSGSAAAGGSTFYLEWGRNEAGARCPMLAFFCIIISRQEIIDVQRCPVFLQGELSVCQSASYRLGHTGHKGERHRRLLQAAPPSPPFICPSAPTSPDTCSPKDARSEEFSPEAALCISAEPAPCILQHLPPLWKLRGGWTHRRRRPAWTRSPLRCHHALL